MAARPLVNDALWRCLCPSFNSFTSIRGLSSVKACLPARQPPGAFGERLQPSSGRSRSVSSIACISNEVDTKPGPQPGSPARTNAQSIQRPHPNRHYQRGPPDLVLLPTADLYERLRSDAAAGRYEEVFNAVKILIKDRRERPNIRLYAAMLHSFVNPEYGTAGKIRKVLEEMAELGVDLDAGGCHAVLEALAVHPDYLLREEILTYMKGRWFTLTDRGHNMVVAGLLRDRLFEQAIQKIEDMNQQRIRVADWLLDKAVWILLDYGEMDEAWQLLRMRQQSGRTTISPPLWAHFLDTAAKLCHVESVTHIWTTRVIPGYLKPPSATCLHVLNIAARTSNVDLATDVFRVLAERDTVLMSFHYEMILEAYLNASDIGAAISVIMIMAEAGIKVDEASIYPLYVYLKQTHARPIEAFSILQTSHTAGRKVPTAAINACIQASVHLGRLEEALDIYKALHTVSPAGPNIQTFNILFQGCHKAGRKELAMFLVSEMIKLGITPNALTYDRLILVCCHANHLEDAFLYYEEMRLSNWSPRRGTFERLIELGLAHDDAKTLQVLEDMRICGYIPTRATKISVKEKFPETVAPLNDGTELP
ncbi:uncharacterized protein EI97DRAFT_455467 [Westerdykella ornata]|uniref:Pentatricopeptide repeat-containing protein-mitochondrial domain-containing protein n=1 Tax=Westerdykella ornata TaxID=318751 RepID=A0A6A6JVV8_WESOR|nr:uncharacterized protein EI97DRAFT_455467 [Westerdykella ornata]KAF2279189.1 hypothetical protein EI97DRAFT_455467 [Westerdykella ornata]